MPKIFGLAFIGMACLANAMQLPGMWDIFDVATVLLAIVAGMLIVGGE